MRELKNAQPKIASAKLIKKITKIDTVQDAVVVLQKTFQLYLKSVVQNPETSIRHPVQQLLIKKKTFHNILNNHLKLRDCKIQLAEKLKLNDHQNFLFSDEVHFHLKNMSGNNTAGYDVRKIRK